jgi:hypothetical protein
MREESTLPLALDRPTAHSYPMSALFEGHDYNAARIEREFEAHYDGFVSGLESALGRMDPVVLRDLPASRTRPRREGRAPAH